MINSTAVILAGGKSSRMGQNKALLKLEEKTLIEIMLEKVSDFDEIFISSNEPDLYTFTGVTVIMDQDKGFGPLQGILSCLAKSKYEQISVLPCDAPLIPKELPQYILEQSNGYDATIATYNSNNEPLIATYNKSIMPILSELHSQGIGKVGMAFAKCNTNYVELDRISTFGDPKKYLLNTNDPATFEILSSLYKLQDSIV